VVDIETGRQLAVLSIGNGIQSAKFFDKGALIVATVGYVEWEVVDEVHRGGIAAPIEKVMQEAWDVSFAAGHTGRALIRAVCADKLTGAHEFTTEELQHLLLLGRPSTAVRPTAPRTGARPPIARCRPRP
jgi:hypothetical protein